MINESLHKKPAALDRNKHRDWKLDRTARDMTRNKAMNAFFIAASEFGEAAKDYPLVWVPAGTDAQGKPQVASIAVFGLQQGVNLCIDAADRWRVRYVPVMLRTYPFAMARTSDTEMVVCIDEDWIGLGTEKGDPLFKPDGSPSELTLAVQQQLEQLEMDIERSRLYGAKLLELKLLRDMQFDATLPDGGKVQVTGFLTIDEERLNSLSDAEMLDVARSGLLGLIHAHQISLSNMSRLAEWHAERQAAAAPAAVTTA